MRADCEGGPWAACVAREPVADIAADPQAWLADVLARIASHPAHRLDELLPWNWKPNLDGPAAQAARPWRRSTKMHAKVNIQEMHIKAVRTNNHTTKDCSLRLPIARKLLDSLPRLQIGFNISVTKNFD